MKTKVLFIILLIITIDSNGQLKYQGSIHTGYLKNLARTTTIDAQIGWLGYKLNNRQNGISMGIKNGLLIKDLYLIQIDLQYFNFEGISGFALGADQSIRIGQQKLAPIFSIEFGYSYVNNQYLTGSNSLYIESALGLSYRFSELYSLQIMSGATLTQQHFFIPIKLQMNIVK